MSEIKDKLVRAIIEPPENHPNIQFVSGERIPVVILMPGDEYPWHAPWSGWKITEVVDEDDN